MNKIIDVATREEVKFSKADLPVLIHGKEHSGASLLSITIASLLHESGNKLCIFTAYHMAKEEFLKQIKNPEAVFYLESDNDFAQALKFQTIIIQNGNTDLFIKVVSNSSIMSNRVVFIKNIETIDKPILHFVTKHSFIVSGDLELNSSQREFNILRYNTKILFNSFMGEIVPLLKKYQALMKSKTKEKIIVVN